MRDRPRLIAYLIIAAVTLLLWLGIATVTLAQTTAIPPSGMSVLNQGQQARLLTKSDTTNVLVTRGIFIGDATACDVALILTGDSAAVTFHNVQSGAVYPFQIRRLMSANTTCTSVVALY